MLGIQYFKADSSTFVIKTSGGKICNKGKGLSFFYSSATNSIAAIPVNIQDAPFIFNLLTVDFQDVRIQGQISYRIVDPETIAGMLNFNLKRDGRSYVSEDPIRLSDQIVRAVQTIVQRKVQALGLREALRLNQPLEQLIKKEFSQPSTPLDGLGIRLVNVNIAAISPSTETSRALEAEVREEILKEADDAIYTRRKSAVEQERMIKEAELQTELFIEQKEQEIEESRIANERSLLRGRTETERERIQAEIDEETQRKELVLLNVENKQREADSEAYNISVRMKAFATLPVTLKSQK